MNVVAIHGLPTSPLLWSQLHLPQEWTLSCPPVYGLGGEGTPIDWSLNSCVDRLKPVVEHADILIGHDLGGVLCAMMAKPGQRVILSGTALGIYWMGIRATALPVLHHFFYQRYAGKRFISKGCLEAHRADLLASFGDNGPDWPDRMRRIAKGMTPPANLVKRLKTCSVELIWGTKDPWYPPIVARAIQRATGAQLHWLPCGHFTPWEEPVSFGNIVSSGHQRA